MKIQTLEIDKEFIKNSIKAQGDKRFYVYVHRKISDNKPFYVGKGTKYRCLTIYKRSSYWLNTALKHGVYVQIYKNNLTSKEACEIEKKIIKKLGIKKLVNISFGGENGLVGEANHMYGKRLIRSLNGNFGNKGILNPLSNPILCFDLNGDFIKEYESASLSEEDGFCASTVVAVCNKKRKQHKNHIFIRKSEYHLNQKITYVRDFNFRKKIESYDLNGNFVKSYNSINQTKKDGFDPKKVSLVCSGKNKTHKSMFFKIKAI